MMQRLEFECLDCGGHGAVPDSSSDTGATKCSACKGKGRVAEDMRTEKAKARDAMRQKS